MVVGTSTTRKSCASAPISSSDDWYCGWASVTVEVTVARMARSPKEVSVMR
jgi:hypothetical protein